jgi:hypothetical protein
MEPLPQNIVSVKGKLIGTARQNYFFYLPINGYVPI